MLNWFSTNRRPLPGGVFENEPKPNPKIIRLFVPKMVHDFKHGPFVGRRLPYRLWTANQTHQALKDRSIRFQSVNYPGRIHRHASRPLSFDYRQERG